MNKKYKLLKDLPDAKTGDEYHLIWRLFCNQNRVAIAFEKDFVEKRPEWFSEIKEKERIEITEAVRVSGAISNFDGTPFNVYHLHSTVKIPEDKLPLIKQAIEKELNDEQPEEKPIGDFLAYLVSQKELYVKRNDFETASQWRMVERLYRQYQKINSDNPEGKYITLEECVNMYVRQEQLGWASTNKYFQHKPIEPNPMVFAEHEYIPKSGEFITAEKARRMAQRAFSASRLTNSCSINSGYIYRTFEDYEATITSPPDQSKPPGPVQ